MSLWIEGTNEGFEKGTTYVGHAADLWSLVDPKRAENVNRWLHDWWEPHDQDPDIKVYGRVGLQHLLELLDGLGDALSAEVTDRHWRVDRSVAERIRALNPSLVDSWESPDGTVFTVANRVSEIHQLEALVKEAIGMNRTLEDRLWAGT